MKQKYCTRIYIPNIVFNYPLISNEACHRYNHNYGLYIVILLPNFRLINISKTAMVFLVSLKLNGIGDQNIYILACHRYNDCQPEKNAEKMK